MKTYLVEKMVGVAALTLALAWVGPTWLDQSLDDVGAAQAAHAQHVAERQEKRRHAAAASICAGGVPTWLDDTTLSCAPRRGNGQPAIYKGALK